MSKISVNQNNINSPAPKTWRKIENILLILIIPSVVLVLTNWGFKNEILLNRLILIINVLLVALIKGIGMFLSDEEPVKVNAVAGEEQEGDGAGTPNKAP